eukprot:3592856-Pyramimonas_sp.AAC.1
MQRLSIRRGCTSNPQPWALSEASEAESRGPSSRVLRWRRRGRGIPRGGSGFQLSPESSSQGRLNILPRAPMVLSNVPLDTQPRSIRVPPGSSSPPAGPTQGPPGGPTNASNNRTKILQAPGGGGGGLGVQTRCIQLPLQAGKRAAWWRLSSPSQRSN